MSNVNFINIDERTDIAKEAANQILLCFEAMKEKDLYILNRVVSPLTIMNFADALYDYSAGVVLVERMYRQEKCIKKGTEMTTYSDKDKKTLADFNKFVTDILPRINELGEDSKEIKKYNRLQKKVGKIKGEKVIADSYYYDRYPVIELASMGKEALTGLSESYANATLAMLSALTWGNAGQGGYAIVTLEQDDYIDMVLISLKEEKSED